MSESFDTAGPQEDFIESRLVSPLPEIEEPALEIPRPSRLADSGKGRMICSCTKICERDVHDAIAMLQAEDPFTILTAGRVCRALGKRPECGNCLPNLVKVLFSLDEEEQAETSVSCRSSCDDLCKLD